MATSLLTQLLQELKGLSPSDRQALAEVLANKPVSADTSAPNPPCDFSGGHVWSDARTNHLGRKVPRSCKTCGVLALHTGELHGVHEDDLPEATNAEAAPEVEEVSPPPVVTSNKRKKARSAV